MELHTEKLKWRSAFYTFMRLPGGRPETLKYIEKVNRKDGFPVGTQFALIEQAFLISDKGERILSPLIVSISLRAYLDVNLSAGDARPAATQCVAEFVMQPRQLMQDNAVMKALGPGDYRFEAGDAQGPDGGTEDPFEARELSSYRPRLKFCMSCHSSAGHRSVQTDHLPASRRLFEGSPAAISKSTSAKKQEHESWKTLHELWQADSTR